jgi:hypothetical protein
VLQKAARIEYASLYCFISEEKVLWREKNTVEIKELIRLHTTYLIYK